MNILTRCLTAPARFHYQWIADDINDLQETCTALRGIGMGTSAAFSSVVNELAVHRGELDDVAAKLKAKGLEQEDYGMTKLEGSIWALVTAAALTAVLVQLFGR